MPNACERPLLYLVGAGPMAREYARVLLAQDVPFQVIGRGSRSAKQFEQQLGLPVFTGGLEHRLAQHSAPAAAIVTVGPDALAGTTTTLLQAGVRRILVEKPGALDLQQLGNLVESCRDAEAQVYIAYNRRFYASIMAAERILREDGGLSSFHFEFTEWSHQIATLDKPSHILAHWFFLNSTHVIDLAFHLGGTPNELSCYTAGTLDWHPQAAVFCGAGMTIKNALFSYHANWCAPGRWGLELLSKRHRLVLRPLEQLHVQALGSTELQPVDLDDELDRRFKPGLYRQLQAFLRADSSSRLPTLEQQFELASTVLNSIVAPDGRQRVGQERRRGAA